MAWKERKLYGKGGGGVKKRPREEKTISASDMKIYGDSVHLMENGNL